MGLLGHEDEGQDVCLHVDNASIGEGLLNSFYHRSESRVSQHVWVKVYSVML